MALLLSCAVQLTMAFTLRAPPPRMSEPAMRSMSPAEEKAMREVRTFFGGYPPGKYFTLEEYNSTEAACTQVRADYPILNEWSDAEIRLVVQEIKPTPTELFWGTPLGPFLILSGISIWRDGMEPWGIPPCRDYLDACVALSDATTNLLGGGS